MADDNSRSGRSQSSFRSGSHSGSKSRHGSTSGSRSGFRSGHRSGSKSGSGSSGKTGRKTYSKSSQSFKSYGHHYGNHSYRQDKKADDKRSDTYQGNRSGQGADYRHHGGFQGKTSQVDRKETGSSSFTDKRYRGNHQGRQSSANYDHGRRNSDGTVSYPSQNPYTDRRPGEPKMPKGLEWSMLSREEKERLRGLSKEHAENIGLHMLAAYALEDSDPEAALEHAKWIARQASRIDMARETLALIAYRAGKYKLALKEFRTAYRMNGYGDYLPFMADCERGTGNPKKAIELATSQEAQELRGESKAEMFLVYAGALADLEKYDKAIDVVHTLAHARGVGGAYRMRAVQAEQYFNEQAGHEEAARVLDSLLDKLEAEYADREEEPEEDVVDNDMENIDDDMLRGMGIDPADFYRHPDEEEPQAEEESGSGSHEEPDSDPQSETALTEPAPAQLENENSPENGDSSEPDGQEEPQENSQEVDA